MNNYKYQWSRSFADLGPRCPRLSGLKIFTKTAVLLIEIKLHIELQRGRGNQSLVTGSGSLDQDGCHAHIWQTGFEISGT